MPDPNGLDVHHVLAKHLQTFDSTGKPVSNTQVDFQVGEHGPFHLFYPTGEVKPDQVNGDIDKHVQNLRAIVNRT